MQRLNSAAFVQDGGKDGLWATTTLAEPVSVNEPSMSYNTKSCSHLKHIQNLKQKRKYHINITIT